MQHDGDVALVLVSGAKGPVVRDRDVQGLAKLRCGDFADLFYVFGIAKIGGHGRETQPAKSEDDTQSDKPASNFMVRDSAMNNLRCKGAGVSKD